MYKHHHKRQIKPLPQVIDTRLDQGNHCAAGGAKGFDGGRSDTNRSSRTHRLTGAGEFQKPRRRHWRTMVPCINRVHNLTSTTKNNCT